MSVKSGILLLKTGKMVLSITLIAIQVHTVVFAANRLLLCHNDITKMNKHHV
jgi:hypothetical protein